MGGGEVGRVKDAMSGLQLLRSGKFEGGGGGGRVERVGRVKDAMSGLQLLRSGKSCNMKFLKFLSFTLQLNKFLKKKHEGKIFIMANWYLISEKFVPNLLSLNMGNENSFMIFYLIE